MGEGKEGDSTTGHKEGRGGPVLNAPLLKGGGTLVSWEKFNTSKRGGEGFMICPDRKREIEKNTRRMKKREKKGGKNHPFAWSYRESISLHHQKRTGKKKKKSDARR